MPSRDNRGRFVSFPVTEAPSWYVFCAAGYRIPGEPSPVVFAASAPIPRQPIPRAIARARRTPRTPLRRADLLIYLLMAIGYVAMLWYGLHLRKGR